jgi:hypothetical protein
MEIITEFTAADAVVAWLKAFTIVLLDDVLGFREQPKKIRHTCVAVLVVARNFCMMVELEKEIHDGKTNVLMLS